MDIQGILFEIGKCAPGLLFAIIIHEYAHGRVAKHFGDDTAEREGRLSFNPAVHIDPIGTIFFPLLGIVFGWAAIGWAKPVPISVRNFKQSEFRKAIFWVSFAGPLSNFILGTFSAFLFVVTSLYIPRDFAFSAQIIGMLEYSIFINFLLGAFNIIPFPPLDGSRMLASFLKGETLRRYESLGQYSFYIIMGIFALSMMGIPTIHYLLAPFMDFARELPYFFVSFFV